jgi:hypothetical protein
LHEAIDHSRRLCGAAAFTFTAVELGVIGAAHAETTPPQPAAIKAVTNTSFPPLKQIDAGVLNIGYAEAGPPDGPPGHEGGRFEVKDRLQPAGCSIRT